MVFKQVDSARDEVDGRTGIRVCAGEGEDGGVRTEQKQKKGGTGKERGERQQGRQQQTKKVQRESIGGRKKADEERTSPAMLPALSARTNFPTFPHPSVPPLSGPPSLLTASRRHQRCSPRCTSRTGSSSSQGTRQPACPPASPLASRPRSCAARARAPPSHDGSATR